MLSTLPSSTPAIKALATELFDGLRAESFDGVGITRASYGPSETQAMLLLADMASREKLSIGAISIFQTLLRPFHNAICRVDLISAKGSRQNNAHYVTAM